MELDKIQSAIREAGLDGWLFYDFHNRDPIAYRILGLDFGKFTSRRWFYFIPAHGEPVRLVSRVEPSRLDALPGEKRFYLSWKELTESLKEILNGRRVAMQYSPQGAIPYVSLVDGGTLDMVRTAGADVVSSADLVQRFEAINDEDGYESHVEAGRRIHRIKDEAFSLIHEALSSGTTLTELDVQRFILRRFLDLELDCLGENPIVGINDHPCDPHFEPTPENSRVISRGDTILIDLWAKLARPQAIFYDITWCGYAGDNPPEEYARIFDIVCRARDAAIEFLKERFSAGMECSGYEVDDVCRKVVSDAGYGQYFIHRTGHSIGVQVHGNGVNMDNLETCDLRKIVPGICFSIEPGIYLPGRMAVRTEVNVFIRPQGEVEVTGPVQRELIRV